MAVPKAKSSKQRKNKRKANWKIEAKNFATCRECGFKKLPHRACASCGKYNGHVAIATAEEN